MYSCPTAEPRAPCPAAHAMYGRATGERFSESTGPTPGSADYDNALQAPPTRFAPLSARRFDGNVPPPPPPPPPKSLVISPRASREHRSSSIPSPSPLVAAQTIVSKLRRSSDWQVDGNSDDCAHRAATCSDGSNRHRRSSSGEPPPPRHADENGNDGAPALDNVAAAATQRQLKDTLKEVDLGRAAAGRMQKDIDRLRYASLQFPRAAAWLLAAGSATASHRSLRSGTSATRGARQPRTRASPIRRRRPSFGGKGRTSCSSARR